MGGQRVIKIPYKKYQEAKEFKRVLQREKNLNIPLWRCMIALEETKRNDDPFRVFK